MPHGIFVDSTFRKSGSHSDFEFQLEETLYVEDARVRIDKLSFVDTFYTITPSNQVLYLLKDLEQSFYMIPPQAYTGKQLAQAIQVQTGYTTTYFEPTNSIRMTVGDADVKVLSDEQLKGGPPAGTADAWPVGAGPSDPKSINGILGPSVREGSQIVFPFVNMARFNAVYLRSNRLSCHHVHGPRGEAGILCRIPINKGIATVIEDQTPEMVWLDLGTHSLRTLDFRLTDANGTVVDLQNQPLSFQITID